MEKKKTSKRKKLKVVVVNPPTEEQMKATIKRIEESINSLYGPRKNNF